MSRIIELYLETNKKRELIGSFKETDSGFEFNYKKGFKDEIDQDFPVGKKSTFRELPEFFSERIPPLDSPQRDHYTKVWKLNLQEASDFMSLLCTVGHRGASNIVFYPKNFSPGLWKQRK